MTQSLEMEQQRGITGAEELRAYSEDHLKKTAEVIAQGGITVVAFNGVYGIFGDADNPLATEKIHEAKDRPIDKKLILVSDPNHLDEHVDFSMCSYSLDQIANLQRSLHALGIILPASNKAPKNLVVNDTVLSIWTEYYPIQRILNHFRGLGGRALVGTSANKSGQSTHHNENDVWQDFRKDVDLVVLDNFGHLPSLRRRSTSVIDLSTNAPILHRDGNTTVQEIQTALSLNHFPELFVPGQVLKVNPRK